MLEYVYVAGPYSGDVLHNTRNAVFQADILRSAGFTPFIPHAMTLPWDLAFPHDYEFWLEFDFRWVARCDAVLRLPGESAGADREVRMAKSLGIPVFASVVELIEANRRLATIMAEG